MSKGASGAGFETSVVTRPIDRLIRSELWLEWLDISQDVFSGGTLLFRRAIKWWHVQIYSGCRCLFLSTRREWLCGRFAGAANYNSKQIRCLLMEAIR